MRRREPSSHATWMLEHLALGDHDEALGGDLLEEFRAGRSDVWYWRQVLAACAVSWLESLRTRTPLLVFALLWSMLAPAWKVLTDRIQDYQIFSHTWEIFRGFWIVPAFALWTSLHSIFLWAGMLIYILSHESLGKAFRSENVRRAFLLAPLIFLPVIGAAFVLMNLYSFPGLVNDRLATTPLAQVADMRMPADVLRFPYFVALLYALWGVISRTSRTSSSVLVESGPIGYTPKSDTIALLPTLDPFTLRRFFGFMVCAGLMNAMIGGFLLCRLPASHAPSFASLLIRAAVYVAIGVLAGVAGTWLYWRNPSSPFRQGAPLPFTLFTLVCAAGWVWVPPIAIYSEQLSTAAAFVAMIGALVLASGLRSATYFVFVSAQHSPSPFESADAELFADSLTRLPFESHGYVIAISLYAAGAALLTHSVYTATVLLALSAFVFAWKRTVPRSGQVVSSYEVRRAALRLARVAIPAVLITVWALLDGVRHRNQVAQANTASAVSDGLHESVQVSARGLGGYESVILWPYPEKKQITPPLPIEDSLLAPGTKQPIVIRFNGPYWYLQPPDRRPGPMAHQANGTPVSVDIESNNGLPLVMKAHQALSIPIRTSRCREIQVEIENRDNTAGAIWLAVLLTDTTSAQNQTLYLGEQPIISTEPGHFSVKRSPAFETLRFSVPTNGNVKKFNEVTVQILPDIEHALVAPKIAILQFQVLPR